VTIMKLSKITAGLRCEIFGNPDTEVTGVSYDSRKVEKGDAFVALAGYHTTGKQYIADALSKGAGVIVTDEKIETPCAVVVVEDTLKALSHLSSRFYDIPDKKMYLMGVTGTNGKTTITYFIESIFEQARRSIGVIGTINYRFAGQSFKSVNTTPQSADLFSILSRMVGTKCRNCVMEVSSHALALGRVADLEFDLAIFTNLTIDHLDFHVDMQGYFEAKSKLFLGLRPGVKKGPKFAIINIDDPWGKKLAGITQFAKVITYGKTRKSDFSAANIRLSSHGSEFLMISPMGRNKVCLPHLGIHNVYNALASAAAAYSAGIPKHIIIRGLEQAPIVPGRLEKVEEGQPFSVVVDYAHTPDALQNVLCALKELKPQRIITIFGCGGERDRSKRPIMGDIATELSDFVFVTSDNPRSEDEGRIALDVEVGIRRRSRNNYQVILEREKAIASALNMARKQDIILIAGKGHETYQIIGDKRIHFNDIEVAKKYLSNLHGKPFFE
jgi:UDP-N-acetylmuramoyl-L-alanyl-D-glutamate--2,6-diaminopimelate ligase